MKVTSIKYQKTFNLGNYSNEVIGMEAGVEEGEGLLQAVIELRKAVEHAHNIREDLRKREQAEEVLRNPDRYTGYDVKQAGSFIDQFNKNYPQLKSMMADNLLLEEKKHSDFEENF